VLTAVLAALGLLWAVPAGAHAKVVWLCKPGMRANPCEPSLTTTAFSPSGKRLGVRHVHRLAHRRADCFYVYPTVSDQQRPQATQVVDDVLRSIALYQSARYSRDCRVFAPVYRQITIQGLLHPENVTLQMGEQAYTDVLEAWRAYLSRAPRGRGVILIGHSQGTFLLRRLIAAEIDPNPALRRRVFSAILLGGNVTVKKGGDRDGDFEHIRACRSPRQLHCAIAFSTFNATPPPDSLFGRTTDPALEVLCTNPAALGGGAAAIDPVYPTKPFAPSVIGSAANLAVSGLPHPKTPWATFPSSLTAHCSRAGGADVLRVKPRSSKFQLTPVPDATWGLHLADANIALGNLTSLVRRQIARYERLRQR
jgi:hypothetical protein